MMSYTRTAKTVFKAFIAVTALTALTSCGVIGTKGKYVDPGDNKTDTSEGIKNANEGSIFDLFRKSDPDITVAVNRYLWNASLDVLNFLPVQSVDPFTGVIIFGYGTPPGGGKSYRATVYIKDPALEARSLVVAMQTRGGRPVSATTQRAVEDAILARARQLRIADKKF